MSTTPFLTGLSRVSAQAGVLVLLILALQWTLRDRFGPRARCLLWWLVAARLLVPVSFPSSLSVYNWGPQPGSAARLDPMGPGAAIGSTRKTDSPERKAGLVHDNAGETAPPETASVASRSPLFTQTGKSLVRDAEHVRGRPQAVTPRFSGGDLLVALWLAGAVATSTYVLVQVLRTARRFHTATAMEDKEVRAVMEGCGRDLGIKRLPILAESFLAASPILYGFLRPRLILPQGLTCSFGRDELRCVFWHELAHLRRRDLPLNWLLTGLQIIHWFNPLLWLGFARWRQDREHVCDVIALEALGMDRRKDYGRAILKLLAAAVEPSPAPGAVGMLESTRQLRERIRMIAKFRPSPRRPAVALGLMLALGFVFLTDAQVGQPRIPGGANRGRNAAESSQKAAPLARIYFAGTQLISARTSVAHLHEILSLPESQALWTLVCQKLGASLQSHQAPADRGVIVAERLHPVLATLCGSETCFEVRSWSPLQCVITARLESQPAKGLETNLTQLLGALSFGTPEPVRHNSGHGWRVRGTDAEDAISYAYDEGSAVVSFGMDAPSGVPAKVFSEIATNEAILSVELNSPADWIRYLPRELDQIQFTVSPRSGRLRSEGTVRLAGKGEWALEPWTIPTNTIREPLIAFTAMQGIRSWISSMPSLQKLAINPLPNQAFLWSHQTTPFSLYAAASLPDVTNVLNRVASEAMPSWIKDSWVEKVGGNLLSVTNLGGIFWRELPYIVPFIRPGHESDRPFAWAGLLPLNESSQPPPAALLDQIIPRQNLVYYDWEITAARIAQWDQVAKMVSALDWRVSRPVDRPAQKWLAAISPLLANSVTELAATTPNTLSLVRRSDLGLSSLELVAVARWIDSASFPALSPDFWLETKPAPRTAKN